MVALPDFSARDDAFIRKAVAQSNVVINLIGEERETPRFKFEEVKLLETMRCFRQSHYGRGHFRSHLRTW